ncbi:MAG: hypothetical protein [Asgard archaea virus VerdaV3]|nr:MAG: hypothetical protein [Asgard archaea virus VerdaV3]
MTKFLNIEINKSTKKQLKDLKYWLDEDFVVLIPRLVKEEWEKNKPKSS